MTTNNIRGPARAGSAGLGTGAATNKESLSTAREAVRAGSPSPCGNGGGAVHHVHLIDKGCLTSDGHLIYCARCFEKDHVARWHLQATLAHRFTVFTTKHRGCR